MTFTDEFDELIEEILISDGMSPDSFAELIANELDVSEQTVIDYLKEEYSLTDAPGRRGFKYCLRCNPHLNGSYGKEGTEAVAKQHIEDDPDTEQHLTGWEPLCYDCASKLKPNPYITLEPLPGNEDLDLFDDEEDTSETPTHECQDPTWTKLSLVTEAGMFDWVECVECEIQAKRYNPNNIEIVGYNAR